MSLGRQAARTSFLRGMPAENLLVSSLKRNVTTTSVSVTDPDWLGKRKAKPMMIMTSRPLLRRSPEHLPMVVRGRTMTLRNLQPETRRRSLPGLRSCGGPKRLLLSSRLTRFKRTGQMLHHSSLLQKIKLMLLAAVAEARDVEAIVAVALQLLKTTNLKAKVIREDNLGVHHAMKDWQLLMMALSKFKSPATNNKKTDEVLEVEVATMEDVAVWSVFRMLLTKSPSRQVAEVEDVLRLPYKIEPKKV